MRFRGKWKGMLILCGILMTTVSGGCGVGAGDSKNLLLHLKFDEKAGTAIEDSSQKTKQGEVNYRYTHAVYTEKKEPEWRVKGVDKGCLLFDGNSTYIEYTPEEICVEGKAFSVSVWVAPRAFEWDDPQAAEKGEEHLTAIAGQFNKEKKEGFLLGYQRFGRLCFQIGTGDSWITLWGEGENLQKYQWNQVTAVFDGKNGNISLFLNGEQIGCQKIEKNTEIKPAKKEKLFIGKNPEAEQIAAGAYNMFSGLMDDLKIYPYALREEEIPNKEAPEIEFEDIRLENILTDDIYKTQFHGGPYQHWMNEPHAPFYYNGMYHLFYQCNPVGTYWRNICWGHLVSEDMVNWKPIKEAITPTENSVAPDGIWSGGVAIDKNGVPLLFFTAGNDSFLKDGLISNQNIGVAYPADLSDPYLTDWVMAEELAVKQEEGQGRTGEFRDPHIWKEGNVWNMLVCSGSTESQGGSALLYQTEKLELKDDKTIDMAWQYKGPVYEMENPSVTYGTSWELPIILPVSNEARTISRHIFLMSPAPAGVADNKIYYFLGDFDVKTGKFTPDETFDNQPGLLDYGSNVFTGPSAFLDSESEKLCMFSIMQDQRSGAEEGAAGWAHCVGLTRNLWLNDEGTDIMMAPDSHLDSLKNHILIEEENLSLEKANEQLAKVKGDLLYVETVLDLENAEEFGIRLKTDGKRNEVSYVYNCEENSIAGHTRNKGKTASSSHVSGPLLLENGKLTMKIYVDRSLIEGYFNDRKSISIRDYGEYEAQGMQFFGQGDILVERLYVSEMKSIYEK